MTAICDPAPPSTFSLKIVGLFLPSPFSALKLGYPDGKRILVRSSFGKSNKNRVDAV
jgi:hypothetical protein